MRRRRMAVNRRMSHSRMAGFAFRERLLFING
jgi:hypothetical protein